MKIIIETIPHNEQRYETIGDWYYDADGNLNIKVSHLSDWRRSMLVAVHELVEVLACKHDGVSQKSVDDFDMNFEANRKPGDDSEPGDASDAPYKFQHGLATGIERVLASAWGVDWADYEEEINGISKESPSGGK